MAGRKRSAQRRLLERLDDTGRAGDRRPPTRPAAKPPGGPFGRTGSAYDDEAPLARPRKTIIQAPTASRSVARKAAAHGEVAGTGTGGL